MYAVALIGDLLAGIPVVNWVSDFVTWVVLGMMGSHTGVNLNSSQMIGGTILAAVITAVPIPIPKFAWTIRVYFAKKAAKESAEQAA